MARQCGLSQSTVSRIWRAFSLQPHRSETFKLSPDPLFIDKVRDIVGLYLHPPEKALVLSVDEKAQIQALDRSQPLSPMRPGQVERRTHDYVRHGTTSLFAALDTQSGPRDRPTPSSAPGDGVPEVPRYDRCWGPRGSGCPSHRRQLRDPEDGPDPALARQAPPVSSALHAEGRLLDQSGRALVRVAHRKAHCGAASTAARAILRPPSTDTWPCTTKRRSPSCGPRRPMRFSPASPAFVIGSRTQDTRGVSKVSPSWRNQDLLSEDHAQSYGLHVHGRL
jgi:hypothetical protein